MRRLPFLLPLLLLAAMAVWICGLLLSGRDPHALPSALIGKPLPAFALAAHRGQRRLDAAENAVDVGLDDNGPLRVRVGVEIVLGEAASDYLDRVFSGSGWWLPAFIAAASLAAVAAFDRAAHLQAALGIGLGLIVVYHALWVLFMLRLF